MKNLPAKYGKHYKEFRSAYPYAALKKGFLILKESP